jgi:hypothetical protein
MSGLGRIGWVLASFASLTTYAADFSGVPITGKRAYGRVRDTSMIISRAVIKKLGKVESKDARGKVNGSAQIYALSLTARDGSGFIAYFTVPDDLSIYNVNYRRRPNLTGTHEYRENMRMRNSKVPLGITSAQMLFWHPNKREMQSKVFRSLFSARLVLGSLTPSGITGQMILVMPDMRKSFVSGAFKAQLVGL